MTDIGEVFDPDTGEQMVYAGTARRIVKMPDLVYFLWILVYYSPSSGKYHRLLPDFLAPYKHYTVPTIDASASDDPDIDAYDKPSDSSRSRWKKWIAFLNDFVLKQTDSVPMSDDMLQTDIHHSYMFRYRDRRCWLAVLISAIYSVQTTLTLS